jgi:hypothetical protein
MPQQAKRAIDELHGRFIGKNRIVVVLHIKKEQRKFQKQGIQETRDHNRLSHYHQSSCQNAPHTLIYKKSHPMSQYRAQIHPEGNMRGGGVDHGNHRGYFDSRDLTYKQPIIGTISMSARDGQIALLSAQIDYLQGVKRHEEELQTQKFRREEEYRNLQRQAERQVLRPMQGPQGTTIFVVPTCKRGYPIPIRSRPAQTNMIHPLDYNMSGTIEDTLGVGSLTDLEASIHSHFSRAVSHSPPPPANMHPYFSQSVSHSPPPSASIHSYFSRSVSHSPPPPISLRNSSNPPSLMSSLGAVGSQSGLSDYKSDDQLSEESSPFSPRGFLVDNEDETRPADKSLSYILLEEPEAQKKILKKLLFPLVFESKQSFFLAKSVTEDLVSKCNASELIQVLESPDLLLNCYIVVALSLIK